MAEMKAEERISGAELADTMVLSMPISSQAGTRIMAPPIPSMPPAKPPQKPNSSAFFMYPSDILSSYLSNTYPRLIFFSSILYWVSAMLLAK